MALPSWLLVFMGGMHSQRQGPSPTLGLLGPSHLWRHKSRVSFRGPPCAYNVVDIPHGEVHDTPVILLGITHCFQLPWRPTIDIWMNKKTYMNSYMARNG